MTAERRFVVEITLTVNDAGGTETFLFSADPWATKPTDVPANTSVRGWLKSAGTFKRELFSGARITGAITPSFGNIVLSNHAPVEGGAGVLDHWLGYGISGGKVVVRWGEIGAAYPSAYTTVYIAYCHSFMVDSDVVTIRLRDRLQMLDTPVVTEGFAGTGGVEGTGSVPKPKQFISSDPGLVPPILLDYIYQRYFVQSTATDAHAVWLADPNASPWKVYENGVEIERAADYASLAEFLSATAPAAGTVKFWFGDASTYLPSWRKGPVYFRLGTPPVGELRVYAVGVPTDADHARNGSALGSFTAAHIAMRCGINASDIESASTAIGHAFIDDQTTCKELLSKASLSTQAWFGMTRLDKFRSGYLADPEDDGYYYGVDPAVFGGSAPTAVPTTSLYTFTNDNTKGLRREPVPGMEAPVWSWFIKSRKTWACPVNEAATAELKDMLTRDPWGETFQGVSDITKLRDPGAIVATLELENGDFPNSFSRRILLERLFVLFGGRRDYFTATHKMTDATLALDMHDVVTLQDARFGLSGGRKHRIASIFIDCDAKGANGQTLPTIKYGFWGGEIGDFTGEVSLIDNSGTQTPQVQVGTQSMGLFTQLFYGTVDTGASASSTQNMGLFTQLFYGGVADVDPYFSSVQLLLHGNGSNGSTTITDSSASPVTPTCHGNAALSTTEIKFGSASMAFDGTGDYIDFNTPAKLAIGTGDFTAEGWVYLSSLGAFRHFIQLNDSAGNGGVAFRVSNTNQLEILQIGGSGQSLGTDVTFSSGAWTHWAVTRSGTTVRGFIGGTLLNSSQTISTNFVIGTAEKVTIGGPGFLMNGYLDDLRVTVGVARYTTTFTPPASQFLDS